MYIIFSGPEGGFAGLVDTLEQAEKFIARWPESASYSEITTEKYIKLSETDQSYEVRIDQSGMFSKEPLIEINNEIFWPKGTECLYKDGEGDFTGVTTASSPESAVETLKSRIKSDGNRIPVYHLLDYSNNQIKKLD